MINCADVVADLAAAAESPSALHSQPTADVRWGMKWGGGGGGGVSCDIRQLLTRDRFAKVDGMQAHLHEAS